MKLLNIIIMTALLTGCGTVRPPENLRQTDSPTLTKTVNRELTELPAPNNAPITVAVYSFKDMTGQRKPSSTLSSFSTAVTQGAESYLIRSLQEAGNRQWFTVVERVNLDNLLKERQMIKQSREIYDGAKAVMLPPLTLAGVIVEGGIIDYNSNKMTGGTGARLLGIGAQTSYTQDVVVISLRLVSVQTGEILATTTVEKNLLSTSDGVTALKFFNQGTKAFEYDSGRTFNEPANYAMRSAIETGVVSLVNEGVRLKLWAFKAQ